jgi:hypothetical protein
LSASHGSPLRRLQIRIRGAHPTFLLPVIQQRIIATSSVLIFLRPTILPGEGAT